MGILNWLGIGKDLAQPIEAIGSLYTTDKERIIAQEGLQKAILQPQMAQLETNKILAMSAVFFNSGWQPLIGWTCGFLILVYYLPQIIIDTYVWGGNVINTGIVTPFPMKPDDIMNLVYLLFGFGGMSLARKKLMS